MSAFRVSQRDGMGAARARGGATGTLLRGAAVWPISRVHAAVAPPPIPPRPSPAPRAADYHHRHRPTGGRPHEGGQRRPRRRTVTTGRAAGPGPSRHRLVGPVPHAARADQGRGRSGSAACGRLFGGMRGAGGRRGRTRARICGRGGARRRHESARPVAGE